MAKTEQQSRYVTWFFFFAVLIGAIVAWSQENITAGLLFMVCPVVGWLSFSLWNRYAGNRDFARFGYRGAGIVALLVYLLFIERDKSNALSMALIFIGPAVLVLLIRDFLMRNHSRK